MSNKASKSNSDKHLTTLMSKQTVNGAAIALADYSLDIINYQRDKNILRRAFGSSTKGTSGFKTIVWGFENGKYGVPTFLNHIYVAYQKADDKEQDLFGTDAKIKRGLLHMFDVYAKECTRVLDDWIEKNSETLFPGDNPNWVLETIKEAAKKEDASLSEYLFAETLAYFYEKKDDAAGLKELSKGYADWKKNSKNNILEDNAATDVIELLNDKWKARNQSEKIDNEEKNDIGKLSLRTRRRAAKKKNSEEQNIESQQIKENFAADRNDEKSFETLGFESNVTLIANTMKNVKDDVDRKIIQTFKSKCPMKFVLGKK